MEHKRVLTFGLIFVLLGLSSLAINVEKSKASGIIYIRGDGKIDPPTAHISTFNNITYTLTSNITDSIYVERSNITIDGSGFMLLGSYSLMGINLTEVTNVTVRNMDISGFSIGIHVDRADFNSVTDINISNCLYGIRFGNSSGTLLVNSSIKDCMYGIWVQDSPNSKIIGNKIIKTTSMGSGIGVLYSPNNTISGNTLTNTSIIVGGKTLDDFMQSIDSSNIIDGKNAYYIKNQNGLQISPITHPLTCILGLINSTKVTIEGFALSNAQIPVAYTNYSSITNTTLMGGVQLIASLHNDITNSTIISGISLSASSNNKVASVTTFSISLNNDSCYNTIEDSNITIRIDIDGSSSNNFVARNSIHGWDTGINVDSEHNNITGNKITPDTAGPGLYIGVSLSPNNIMTENTIANCETAGVATEDFATIERNDITECNIGIVSIQKSAHGYTIPGQCIGMVLFENNITHCLSGIRLDGLLNCTIVRNNIESNHDGIDGFGGRHFGNNVIYHNSFVNNTNQVFIEIPELQLYPNIWDNGYPSGGNFWSNYTGFDSNHDGIGDTAYIIDANNTDRYPLMGMFSSFKTSYGCAVDFVSNSSISDVSFNLSPIEVYPPEAILAFNVSGKTDTEGFVRVCIPKILVNGSYVIRFDGEIITNTTYPQVKELTCSNETYEYLYINYTHSEHTIIITGTTIIPEFSSPLILLLFMVTTVLAVIVCRRKLKPHQIAA